MHTAKHSHPKAGAGMPTFFAPAERADPASLKRDTERVLANPLFRAVQESMDGYLMILNRQRQVLSVNRQLLDDLGYATAECLVGKRPGEVIACVHSSEGPGGCGTSLPCSTCGAVLSILASQEKGCPVGGECLASVRRNSHVESVEFRVRATPVKAAGDEYTVVVFNDISGAKRRETLERVFFHDILNTLSGLHGWSQLLRDRFDTIDARDAAEKIATLSDRVVREIRDQRELLRAESGELVVHRDLYPVAEILRMLQLLFAAHDAAEGKTLLFDTANTDEAFVLTDISLLIRVLTNMIKNALEASRPGDTVTVRLRRESERDVAEVVNTADVAEEIRDCFFAKYATCGKQGGTGLGTYTARLIARVHGGDVTLETGKGQGTVVRVALPRLSGPR